MSLQKIASRPISAVKNYYRKMMALPDSPDKVARGVAMGLAFDFLPIPIISIPLSYLMARLIRCSPVAAVATVIFFKLAVPFFYTLDLLTGKALFGEVDGPDLVLSGNLLLAPFLSEVVEQGYPFLLGSLVNAAIAFGVVYPLLRHLLKKKQGNSV